MNMNIKEEYENLDISSGQIKYAKRIQKLLCERLDMELPIEYELSEIVDKPINIPCVATYSPHT